MPLRPPMALPQYRKERLRGKGSVTHPAASRPMRRSLAEPRPSESRPVHAPLACSTIAPVGVRCAHTTAQTRAHTTEDTERRTGIRERTRSERAAGGSEARVGRREEARATYTQQATDVELVGLEFLEPAVRLSTEHLRLLALLKAPHQLLHAVLSTSTLPRTNERARTHRVSRRGCAASECLVH